MERNAQTTGVSRRTFLTTSSAAVVGAAFAGLAAPSEAAMRRPGRGGTLKFGTRFDAAGLDSHRNNQYHTSHPIAAIYTSLTDINLKGEIVPGIAESYEPSKDLKTWIFRLRKGVLFHNGREVDAEAIKLNIERITDPKIGTGWHRGTIKAIDTVDIVDKYTVRFNLYGPDVGLPANVMHYPTNLQAPEAFETASDHPIGTGPFKFVSWTRYNETKLVRFENYWETDAEGNNLPYLDEILGRPKREASVRLTALRTGQLNLIDNMAYADADRFEKRYGDQFNIWKTHLGGVFVTFNWKQGPFQDKRLRHAAAHAIDRNAIHFSVFYGQGDILDQPYPKGDQWHLEGIRSLEYDPEKAKFLVKQAGAVGTPVKIISSANSAYNRECGEVVQQMWRKAGFKASVHPLDSVPRRASLKKGDFHANIPGNSYRFDPEALFGRNLHSKSAYAQQLSGWHNARYDRLTEEAVGTRELAKRQELYAEAWRIVTDEIPHFHLHELPFTSAAAKEVKGYRPCVVAPYTWSGGGIRTTYIEA